MKTSRRTFIKNVSSAGVVSIGASAPGFLDRAALAGEGAPAPARSEGKILVLVQLAGGNDGLNTVIPVADPEYGKLRPGIGIASGAGLRIDDGHALHPAMAGMKDLFDEGALSIVQGVGYENPDRSHFRSMDIWNSGRLSGDLTRDGWLGRALDLHRGSSSGTTPALAIGTGNLPLALVAAKTPVPVIRDTDAFKLQPGVGDRVDRQERRAALDAHIARAAPAGSELEFLRSAAGNAFATAKKLESL